MKDKVKIQPGEAEEKAGQSSLEATDEVKDIPAEEWAKKSDEEKLALINNALKMRGESTRKYMEASEIKKQYELEKARASWLEEQNKQMQDTFQAMLDQRNEIADKGSATTQPPKFDPYNPEKSWEDMQRWIDNQRAEDRKKYDDLAEKMETLATETDVKVNTQRLDSYLDKILPALGPDVRKQDVVTWFNMHKDIVPQIEDGSIDRAIKEEQDRIEKVREETRKEYLEKKDEAAQKAQVKPGSPLSTMTPDIEKLRSRTPAEREDAIAAILHKLRNEGAL